jgi:hypothetical protein
MLVVTSNWCVSDGTLSAEPPRRLIDRFRAEVRRSSLRCGFRHDGGYRPVEAIDVVLAGDTFDWLTSREWTDAIRPWDGGRQAAAVRERVAAGAAHRGRRLLATLAGWMRHGIAVPAADRRGRPSLAASRIVPVRVALLTGDRDRWLEQAAARWAASSRVPVVGTCWSDGDVTVQHGESLDPLYGSCGRQPTLGESLAVDLIARFGASLHDITALRPFAAGLLRRLAGGCLVDAPRRLTGWLAAHEHRATFSGAARQELIDAWHRAVALWHRAARRLPPRFGDGVDLVGCVAACLENSGGGDVGACGEWHSSGWCPPMPAELRSGDASTVILGHLPADSWSSAARRRQIVCLGPRTRQSPDVLEDDLVGPVAVVVRPGREGRLIDRLPLDAAAGTAGDEDDSRGRRGVWLSDASWIGHGIVDAA